MAATDQHYRHQKALDVVFGVSCVLMLGSIVWMFAQDFFREFKVEIREFRNVEEEIAVRTALAQMPDTKKIEAAEEAVKQARSNIDPNELQEVQARIKDALPKKVLSEARYQAVKADFDSELSLYNIQVDQYGVDHSSTKSKKERLDKLRDELNAKLNVFEHDKEDLDGAQRKLAELEKPVTDALDNLKKLNADFDRFAKTAVQKRWKLGDTVRDLPVIDAFASPTRIQQFTLDDYPIDYNFKYVTRYDRCTTCHQGIDRPAYSKDALRALKETPKVMEEKLAGARQLLGKRQELLAANNQDLGYDPSELRVNKVELSDARVSEFCAHPRLDLFVDGNSPHPAEKFGCTSCHAGQGSATDFLLSSHTPDNTPQMERWQKDHSWKSNHYWDFPMQPKRFVESSCVKCHHQMTDLIREGVKNEAPKLLKGYNIVREMGCFGCHDIAGIKGGRWVGPDLRLEPTPPVDSLSPAERAKALADPLNPPGTMRKVGPSLRRLDEKTNPEWVAKWIKAPRDFRPTTRMPHFYRLSNNSPDALPDEQKDFPDAEIQALTHFLFQRSRAGKYEPPLIPESELPPAPADEKQLANGRQLFSEKGCLACHSHDGTATPGLGLPAIHGEATYGPDLSRLAAKLGTRPGDRASARRWLVQWILNPMVHFPRTRMPNTQLTKEEANDIAVWLLSQKADWISPEVAAPTSAILRKLARVWLIKALPSRRELDDRIPLDETKPLKGFTEDERKQMRDDADEQELSAPLTEDKIKMYVGRKAIMQLGCYGCHDIQGFEKTKPIGTPLNDWGRKDPERLAFEDISNYVKGHFHVVPLRDDAKDPKKPAADWRFELVKDADGKEKVKAPYEQFFFDALAHHQREGFLHQKLLEPRSYDYNRIRSWDERLRMPQFQFAQTEPGPDESDPAYQVRATREEAKAREAVMTFILGLVAEPVPFKYVYSPKGDRLAEIKGRQVLDKYNCAGCHMIQPGIYEFGLTPDLLGELQRLHNNYQENEKDDFHVPHNAWMGVPPAKEDQLKAYAIPLVGLDEADSGQVTVRLIRGLQFETARNESLNLPASKTFFAIPRSDLLVAHPPLGGTFADLLAGFLNARDPEKYKTTPGSISDDGRAAGPPILFRQGEKTQPNWLFDFLRNPHLIRPLTVLRMPKFNFSDDEAMSLVNYFAAVDKTGDPGLGLEYPYLAVREREETYLREMNRAYLERLKKDNLYEDRLKQMRAIWQGTWADQGAPQWKARVASLEADLAAAEKAVQAAPDVAAKKKAAADLASLKRAQTALQDEAKQKELYIQEQERKWKEENAYLIDAYRLMAANVPPQQLCLTCHQLGKEGTRDPQGPELALAWQRLRPKWTALWLANPKRFVYYTGMPSNYPANKPGQFQDQFVGPPLSQIEAVRDALMNYPTAHDLPAIRYRPPAGAKGEK